MRPSLENFDFTMTGEGSPLIFLHGWPFHKETYRKIIPLMAPHFTCYNLNSLGMSHNGADLDSQGMDFPDHARRLLHFADAAGLEQFHVLAHNTGATVARIAAARHPGRIKKLVLLNTEMPFHRPPFIPLYQRLMRLPGSSAIFKALMKSQTFRLSAMGFGGSFYEKSQVEGEFKDVVIDHFLRNSQKFEGLKAYLLGLDFKIIDTLDNIHSELKTPVQFIWGKEDVTFPVELARKMAATMSSCKDFVEVSNACFLPHEEQPQDVADNALRFLRGSPI